MTDPQSEISESEPVEASAPPSMADRLAGICIDLRSDLEVSRHVLRGEAHYILRDPVSFGSHRFSLADYRILTHLRADRTLGETFESMVGQNILVEEDGERFYAFILSLHKISFLHLPISDDKSLYQRYESRRKAKRSQMAKSLLFFRVPLFASDAFLSRTMPFVQPFFSRSAFAVWCVVVGLATLVVGRNWEEFTEPVGDIFNSENLPILWLTLITLKVFHEFGHAYATKAFGGRVPEMGVMFMIFTPCAYVDASAAWGFSSKRERVFVCMAGMYVELFIAAACLLAWNVMEPGLWRSVMHNAVMLASVITIGFNINPLMRYDGYYALSDALEIPNLRARAQQEGTGLLKRLLLGVTTPATQISRGLRTGLIAFGLAGGIYKVVLVLGISATIAMKFPVVGMLMGGAYLLSEAVGIIRASIPYLWRSEETEHVRAWAMVLSVIVLGGVPAVLMGIPIPTSVTTAAVLSGQKEIFLRADGSGFVERLPVQVGRVVKPNQLIVQLADPGTQAQLGELQAQLAGAQASLSNSRKLDPASARKDELRVAQLKHETNVRREQVTLLEIRSPLLGTLSNCLDPTDLGRYVQRGEPIAAIIGGKLVVRALLSEEQVATARPKPGQQIEFRSVANPGKILSGRILHVSPQGRRQFDQAFARFLDPADYAVNPVTGLTSRSHFEIEVELESSGQEVPKLQGLRGKLRIPGRAEPLGSGIWRKTQTFFRRLTS